MLRLKDRINLNEDTMAEQVIKPEQEIEYINIKDLVLWTENPRHPIKATATDQDIADRAISNDGRSRWSMDKLFESMGDWYDTSELPTVVLVKDKKNKKDTYVVYDGNRRVLIGKIIHKCVEGFDLPEFDFPKQIPCNVCDKKTALKNIERKHIKDSSWKTLERDIFRHTHMEDPKSIFMVIDEATGIISNNHYLNKRFVKDEIFSAKNLKDLGILVEGGVLKTPYTPEEFEEILWEIIDLVENKDITTRKNRGELISLLEKDDSAVKKIILKKKGNKAQLHTASNFIRLTPRTKQKDTPLFGKKLSLKSGKTNNLYRDLRDMHSECIKDGYSEHFPMLIRIGLRLLCEVAEKELNSKCKEKYLEKYLKRHFDEIKKEQTKDDREYLDNNDLGDLKQKRMLILLQKSGHPSSDTITNEKTIALSTIIGKMLEKTHGTKK